MENKLYLNPFIDVHARVKAFKQRLLEANKDDAAVRNQRILQATKEGDLGFIRKLVVVKALGKLD